MIQSRRVILMMLVSLFISHLSMAQAPTCGGDVPFYSIDLTGNPDSNWISPAHSRDGLCCTASSPERCTSFEIIFDPNTAAISFNIEDGAIPPGALYYQLNCGPQTVAGESLCITGIGPHYLTFCKPGNNTNTYSLQSIAKPTFPADDTVRVGCSVTLQTFGLESQQTVWRSIAPGNSGQYNNLLSCTNCTSPVFTPVSANPASVSYEVCGYPIADECGYNVTVCDTVNVTVFPTLVAAINPSPATFCPGGSATLNAAPTGGDGNYTYTWRNSSNVVIGSGSSVSVSTAGTYSLEVNDGLSSGSCPGSTANVQVSIGNISISVSSVTNASCFGASTGAVDISVSGGSSPYTYNWSNGASSQDLNNIPAGSYSVTVTDANGCSASSSGIVVSQPASGLSTSISSSSNVSCNGGSNGSINLSVSGGTTPYSYQWSSGQSSQDLNNIPAGTYSVTVTDANGCSSVESGIIISQPTALVTSISSSSNVSCNGVGDASIDLSVSGGTQPYSYNWSNNATSQDLNNIGAGTYSVTVTDANGCTSAQTGIIISQPAVLSTSISSSSNVSCNGFSDGSINLSVSGGTTPYSYNWSNGASSQDLNNIPAGTYSVTVTDANGCTSVESGVIISQPAVLNTSISATSNVSCNGFSDGSINLSVSGGTTPYSYQWSSGQSSQDLNNIPAGTYSVTVTDANGCSSVESGIIISQPTALVTSISATSNVSCNGGSNGSINLSVSGGTSPYSYQWNSGQTSQDLNGIPSGTYSVTVTDANGCTSVQSGVIISQPPVLVASIASSTNILCNGGNNGAIDLSVSGGTSPYSYSWSNNATSQDLNNIGAGSYSVTVTDANGCTATASATISQPPVLTSSATAFQYTGGFNISCNGASDGSIDLSVSGGTPGYTYQWSNGSGSQDISGLPAGTYSVTITDANGCSTTRSITLTEPAVLGGQAVVTSNYTFNDPICGVNSTNQDDFIQEVGDVLPTFPNPSNACSSNVPYFEIDLSADADSVWLSDLFSRAGNCCGTSSPDRCVTFSVTLNPNAIGIILSITAGAEPSGSLFWQLGCGGQNSLDSLVCLNGVGPHLVTFCKPGNNANAYKLSSVSSPIFPQDDSTRIGCNETYTLFGFGSGTTWNSIAPGSFGQYNNYLSCTNCNNPTFSPDANAPAFIDYQICGFAACTGTPVCDTFRVYVLPPFIESDGYVSCNGQLDANLGVINVNGGVGPYTYQWSNGATTNNVNGVGPGSYYVTVTDANGCSFEDSVSVGEPPLLVANAIGFDASCNVASDGLAYVQISGGSLPYNILWSTGSINDSIFDLPSGTYTVTVTDGNGCTDSASVIIQEFPTFTISIDNQVDVSCNGGSDGSVDISILGGTGPFSYNWSNNATTQDLTNVPAGVYSVTVVDANGCSLTSSASIGQPSAVSIAINSANDVSCFGGADGSIDISVSGGVGPYSYAWSNNATTQDVSGLSAGLYSVTATDANGCTASTSINIGQPAAVAINVVSVTDVSCFGGADGSIDISVSGGTSPYTYAWSNQSGSQDPSGLSAGTYSVTVTDANGCTASSSATVNQPAAVSISLNSITDASCNGGADGAIDISVSGGTSPYSYGWSNLSGTQDQSNLIAGTYSVTVTDANGCTASASYTVNESSPINISVDNVSHVSCNGANDGSIAISVSGGTSPYTYAWSNQATSEDISGLAGGAYTVTVTDANGCTATASATVNEPAVLVVSVSSVTHVSCFGGSNGAIDISVSGGTQGYSYAWSNQATTQDLSGIAAGSYSVTVTDANGCTATASATVNQPSAISISVISVVDASCNGGADGAIDISVSGGTPGYSYVWSNQATTQDISNLTAGTYTVTVTDANGCTASQSITVNENSSIVPSIASVTNASCFGGSDGAIDLSVSGGTSPYTYVWSNQATSQDISGLSAGSYSVTVTDANGCTASISATVGQAPAIVISLNSITNVSCNGGSNGAIDISVSGGTPGYTYLWSNQATTQDISNLAAGSYSVTVTDANGCTAAASYNVTEPPVLSVTVSSVTDVTCNGGSNGAIDISVSGGTPGYSYNWSPAQGNVQDPSGLSAGTYSVTVTDANGCTATVSATVNQPTPISIQVVSVTDASCNGGQDGAIDISVSGGTPGYTYNWSNQLPPTQDQSGLAAGTYSVTVTDANGCTASQSITVNENSPINITVVSTTNVSCNGGNDGAIDISVSGGTQPYGYQWSNQATTQDISGLSAGTYTVTVTDANGCTASQSVTITQPSPISITLNAISHVSCNGGNNGSIDISVSGGTPPYSYNWSNGATSQDIAALTAGTYSVTVTDANGCTATASYTVNQPTPLVVTLVGISEPTCNGVNNGSIDISVSGGTPPYTYLWSNGGGTSQDPSGLAAGTYTVTVTDANGCTGTVTTTLIAPPAVVITVDSTSSVSCNGGNDGCVYISVSGGTPQYTYLWSNGSNSQDICNLSAGTYTVTVTDANGCTASASATVSQPSPINLSTSVTPVNCNGGNNGAIDLTVSGGTSPYTYAWSNGLPATQDQSALAPGTYSVTVTDANGCTASTSATVNQPNPISVTLDSTTPVSCFGGSNGCVFISVSGGTAPYTYQWSPGGQTSQDICNLSAGTYNVTVTDANGCTGTVSATVTQPQSALTVTVAGTTDANCNGASDGAIDINVSGGTQPYTYQWSPAGGNVQDPSGLPAGTYTVTVTDANGCTATASATINSPTSVVATVVSTTPVSCNDGNDGCIDISVSGGTPPYTYQWSGGQPSTQDLCNLPAGSYNVTVTDANGCTASTSATVSQPSPVVITLVSSTNPTCNGANTGAIDISVGGGTPGYTYQWSGNGVTPATQDQSGLGAGTYGVTVTDSEGCTASASYTLTQPSPINVVVDSVHNAACFGDVNGAVYISVSGGTPGYTYQWSGNGPNTQDNIGLNAGTYTVTVTDAAGCTATASATVDGFDEIVINTTVDGITCSGDEDGSITINSITGGLAPYDISWSTGPADDGKTQLTDLAPGTYTISVTDGNGCDATLTVGIAPVQPLQTSATTSNVSCFGAGDGSIDLSVFGGTQPYTYQWSGGLPSTQDQNGLDGGSYSVTVTDANGCTATAGRQLSEPSEIIATDEHTELNCFGDNSASIDLSVSGGNPPYTYQWSSNAANAQTQDVSSLAAGTYTVTIEDNSGCVKLYSVTIDAPQPFDFSQSVITQPTCADSCNGSVVLNVSGGAGNYFYDWGNLPYQGNTATGLCNGQYTVTVYDASECSQEFSFTMGADECPEITVIAVNDTAQTYENTPVEIAVLVNDTASGPVTPVVIVNPLNGTVEVVNGAIIYTPDNEFVGVDEFTYEICYEGICDQATVVVVVMPQNNFVELGDFVTPNGDGDNDVWYIDGIENFPNNELLIFNRWGNEVYAVKGYQNDWRGNNKQGEDIPDGTYYYILKLNDTDNTTYTGYVVVHR